MGTGVAFPRAVTHAPRASRIATVLRVTLALLAVGIFVGDVCGCEPIREGVMVLTPGVPPRSDCAEGTQRCAGAVPEVCSASHRWWSALPPRADGTPRACAGGCSVTDAGVAVCVAADASTAAESDGGAR